ncbi:hypothetical protein [Streptomyces sp. Ru62]|uniref:hypothetical protein n=1 Tax=Streptomyces sp. Ru62 TaxID=2080745 RepID=UPI000D1C60F4|nr:hypothetical protein [Streptomyces sp. Ru62]
MHSYSEDMLTVWGDDENQSHDSSQNFLNAVHGHQRGLGADTYAEYLPKSDADDAVVLAEQFCAALHGVRGRTYRPMSGYHLYPTCGTSDDYAYSRHIVDERKGKILGFTIERATRPAASTRRGPRWSGSSWTSTPDSSGSVSRHSPESGTGACGEHEPRYTSPLGPSPVKAKANTLSDGRGRVRLDGGPEVGVAEAPGAFFTRACAARRKGLVVWGIGRSFRS